MRYSYDIRQRIDRAIHDATLANLTEAGTLDYVREKTNITIERTQLYKRKSILKTQRVRMWNAYKNNDYAYRMEHLDRIHEAKLVKNIALEKILLFKDDEKKYFQLIKAALLLLEANKRIQELTDLIPDIDTIGVIDDATRQQELSSIPRTEVNPEAIF
jgi:hypothetical protein